MLRKYVHDRAGRGGRRRLGASLQAARSAMDAERSPGTPDSTLSGIVRDRIAFFATAVNSLREPNVRPA